MRFSRFSRFSSFSALGLLGLLSVNFACTTTGSAVKGPAKLSAAQEQLVKAASTKLEMEYQDNDTECVDIQKKLATAIKSSSDVEEQAVLSLWELRLLGRCALSYATFLEEPKADGTTFSPTDPRIYEDYAQGPRLSSEAFWEAAEKYKATAVGDEFAWSASQWGLGGECEGDPICWIGSVSLTDGRYLQMHPNGKHASESATAIAEVATALLAPDVNFGEPLPPSELHNIVVLDELTQSIQACTNCGDAKGKALDALNAVKAARDKAPKPEPVE